MAFIILVLTSTVFLVGKGNHPRPIPRLLGVCGLLATSIVMFITVRRWIKWLVGVLGYMILKLAVSLLLGRTPSVPSIARPRLVFLEFLGALVFALLLCAKYLTHAPRKFETAGLVTLIMGLSFSVICDSCLPIFAGTAVLGTIQLTHERRRVRTTSGSLAP